MTAGSIRALAEPVTLAGGEVEAISIDADVPRVSVGGPLVDDDGAVLGVLTTTPTNGGVAIPVDIARNAALDIVRTS